MDPLSLLDLDLYKWNQMDLFINTEDCTVLIGLPEIKKTLIMVIIKCGSVANVYETRHP